MTGYTLTVWSHVAAAATWIGSMVFFAAVVVPVLRRHGGGPALLAQMGSRFRVLGLSSLAVLVVTGIANLHLRGIGWSVLRERGFWSTELGRPLAWKLGLVAFVLLSTGAHDLVLTKRAARALEADPRSPYAVRHRRLASWLGRVVLLASLAILYFAVTLVRGLG